jgi:hypothetical protein
MPNEIIFYNGFNLLVDIIIAVTVGFFAYRSGIHRGYVQGYGEGEEDYRDSLDRYSDYAYEASRER